MTKRRMMAIAALGWLLAANPAGAAELLLAHPSACPIGDELSSRTEHALGQPLAATADLRCTIHIVHDQGAFAARLEFERHGRPSQLRSFHAPNCEKLSETLAFALVLAISASARASSKPPTANALVPANTSGASSASNRPSPPTGRALEPFERLWRVRGWTPMPRRRPEAAPLEGERFDLARRRRRCRVGRCQLAQLSAERPARR